MYRSPNNLRNSRQSPLSVDNSNSLVTESSSAKAAAAAASRQSPTTSDSHEESDENDKRKSKKFLTNQSVHPSQSRSSSNVSLKSMIIEGGWRYREEDHDRRQLKSMGISNLVNICHDIMRETNESIDRKPPRTSSTNHSFAIVKLEKFRNLTDAGRNSLRRGKLFELMTIVFEAATTSASISELVRIWREATEHNLKSRRSKQSESQPLISYDTAFQHLIRSPDDQLLQITLHASLLSVYHQSDLRPLGKKLGLKRNQFDIESIRNSTEAFRALIQFLREQKKQQKREEQRIDTRKLPYERKKKRGLYANVSGTRFHLIPQAADLSGFYISPDPDFTANLLWNDTLISMDIVSALKPYQKVNHFPMMNEISRKDLLAKNYQRLSTLLPKVYNFAPQTWILPTEYNLWYSHASNKPKKDPSVYILKPTDAAKSEGIAIHCDYKQIKPMDNYIIQDYLREPYLINGCKFDLRIYALITSCDPLRVFIFNNGLIRMCPKEYAVPTPKNALDLSMHLPNYFIDDDENDFDTNTGKKYPIKYLLRYLKEQKQDKSKLLEEIQDVILKTIFLAEPYLLNAYRKCRPGALPTSESVCFELLGFDIFIDKNLKPWIIEVNRCPSFDVSDQTEFDLKIKLLLDTLNLVHFRVSDRTKSQTIEKFEAQNRLYTNLGKQRNRNNQTDELANLKENFFLLQHEEAREYFESHHAGGFLRLFPVDDQTQMKELINLLTKSFEVLSTEKIDPLWNTKYFNRFKGTELSDAIARLEKKYPKENSKFTDVNVELINRTFIFEYSDEESRSSSTHSDRKRKSPSAKSDPYIKQISTQTPPDILRSISLSSSNTPKRDFYSLISTGTVTRPEAELKRPPPGVSATRITEKKMYTTEPPSHENLDPQRPSSTTVEQSNDKSQIVRYSSILRETRQQLVNQTPSKDIRKELQLTQEDFHRLHLLIFDEMNKLCIHYPNKSDKQTYQISTEIIENWEYYKSKIGQFWLAELDTDKRQSIVHIVWNHLQQIMKKVCILDDLIQQLPLHRHLMKLTRRLLANHGQPLWDACLDRHSSWESLFIKSTNQLSVLELECCYRFVDRCREALFIVYQYTMDEKYQQQKQIHQGLTIMVKS